MMRLLSALAIVVIVICLGNVAAAETVNTCGVLRNFRAPTESNNVGEAVVGDQTWFLSGTPGPNTYDPRASVGTNVCLTGETARSDTGPAPLLIRWTLIPNPPPAISLSPTPTAASPVFTSSPTRAPTDSPAGSAPPASGSSSLGFLAVLVGVALIAVIAGRALVTRR